MDRRSGLRLAVVAGLGGLLGGCGNSPSPSAEKPLLTPADPFPSFSPAPLPPPSPYARSSSTRPSPYAWFAGSHELSSGFSLIWAKELTPREAVERLRGSVTGTSVTWDDARAIIVSADDDNRSYLGATRVAGWAMIFDFNYILGIVDTPLRTLSRGTTVISQFLNVELDDQYFYLHNGDLRVAFHPSDPRTRDGSHPDDLNADMRAVGFDLTKPPPAEGYRTEPTQRAFALTERLTGIRVTLDLIQRQTYLTATAPGL